MNRSIALVLCVSLAGCSSTQLSKTSADLTAAAPVAAQITTDTATLAQLAELNKACAVFGVSAATIAPIFQGGAKTTAALIANPGQAYCNELSKTPATPGKIVLPPNTDSNTAAWLATLTTTLQTVQALAPLAAAVL